MPGESTSSNVGAAGMRFPKSTLFRSTPAQSRNVFMNDVWSKGCLLSSGLRNTVLCFTNGEIRRVGTRTP
jgi:hypothetical protein